MVSTELLLDLHLLLLLHHLTGTTEAPSNYHETYTLLLLPLLYLLLVEDINTLLELY